MMSRAVFNLEEADRRNDERLEKAAMAKLNLQPITFKEANAFIEQYHSHHIPPQGWKFGIAVNNGDKIVGVVTVGRPVARHLDNDLTLEVTRCCTDRTKNVASKLYAAAWRATRALGYSRLITYTLIEEEGTSLRAAGWKIIGQTTGGTWNRPKRKRTDKHPIGQKTIWEALPPPGGGDER